jgi:hypothetical protein
MKPRAITPYMSLACPNNVWQRMYEFSLSQCLTASATLLVVVSVFGGRYITLMDALLGPLPREKEEMLLAVSCME